MESNYEFEFRIFVKQGYTPEAGQKALKILDAAAQKDAHSKEPKFKVEIPGVSRFENPFSTWCADQIKILFPDIKYDEFNFLFKLMCKDLDFARICETRFNTWRFEQYQKADKDKPDSEEYKLAEFLSTLQISICESGDRALEGLRNY